MNSIGDNFLYLREGVTGFELSGEQSRDISLMKSLCNKTMKERVALKLDCVGDNVLAP